MHILPSVRQWVLVTWVALLPACKFNCSVGGMDSEKLGKEISGKITAELGTDIKVTCPEVNTEGVTPCSAQAATGVSFVVEVKKNEKGTYDWEAKNVVSGKKLQTIITDRYKEMFQVQLDSVDCPALMIGQDSAHAECKAMSQGVEVPLDVTFANGGVSDVMPKSGVVVSSAAAKLAEDKLAEQGVSAKVDCGPALRISVPGSKFTCTATDANGETMTLYYRVTSNNGNIDMSGTPFE